MEDPAAVALPGRVQHWSRGEGWVLAPLWRLVPGWRGDAERQHHSGTREGELCEQVVPSYVPQPFSTGSRTFSGNVLGTSEVWCPSKAAQGVTVQLGDSMSHVPALTLIPGPACMVGSAAWRGGLLPCLSPRCCPSPQRGWSRPRSTRALVTCSL